MRTSIQVRPHAMMPSKRPESKSPGLPVQSGLPVPNIALLELEAETEVDEQATTRALEMLARWAMRRARVSAGGLRGCGENRATAGGVKGYGAQYAENQLATCGGEGNMGVRGLGQEANARAGQ